MKNCNCWVGVNGEKLCKCGKTASGSDSPEFAGYAKLMLKSQGIYCNEEKSDRFDGLMELTIAITKEDYNKMSEVDYIEILVNTAKE